MPLSPISIPYVQVITYIPSIIPLQHQRRNGREAHAEQPRPEARDGAVVVAVVVVSGFVGLGSRVVAQEILKVRVGGEGDLVGGVLAVLGRVGGAAYELYLGALGGGLSVRGVAINGEGEDMR